MRKEINLLFMMAIFGFFAQYIDGSFGMAYGASLSSILLTIGYLPAMASASVHFAEMFTTAMSGISHIKFGNVRKDIIIPMLIPGIIGGILGAFLISYLPGKLAKPYIAAFLLILGIFILIRFVWQKLEPKDKPISKKLLGPLGFIAAFIDAVAGGGWGPIGTPMLMLTNKAEPRKVIGSIDTSEFLITVAISITFIVTLGIESYNWFLIAGLLIGGAIAAPLAAWSVTKIPPRFLGAIVGIVIVLTNLRTLLGIKGL